MEIDTPGLHGADRDRGCEHGDDRRAVVVALVARTSEFILAAISADASANCHGAANSDPAPASEVDAHTIAATVADQTCADAKTKAAPHAHAKTDDQCTGIARIVAP